MFGYGPFAGGWQWLGLAGIVLFWAAVITGVLVLIRYLSQNGQRPPRAGQQFWQAGPAPYPPPAGPPPAGPAPEQILAERYARGEIDEDEFRRRLAVLRGAAPYPGPPHPPPGFPPPQGPPPPAP